MTCSVSSGVCEGRELFRGVSGTLADVHGTTVFRSTNVTGSSAGRSRTGFTGTEAVPLPAAAALSCLG